MICPLLKSAHICTISDCPYEHPPKMYSIQKLLLIAIEREQKTDNLIRELTEKTTVLYNTLTEICRDAIQNNSATGSSNTLNEADQNQPDDQNNHHENGSGDAQEEVD